MKYLPAIVIGVIVSIVTLTITTVVQGAEPTAAQLKLQEPFLWEKTNSEFIPVSQRLTGMVILNGDSSFTMKIEVYEFVPAARSDYVCVYVESGRSLSGLSCFPASGR